MNILVVDDEQDCCDELALFLKKNKNEISKCYDGKCAIDCVEKSDFDLIITDINLPDISGLQILKKVKDLNKKARVILISGNSNIIDPVNAVKLGAFDFLPKPFDIFHLNDLIRHIEEIKS